MPIYSYICDVCGHRHTDFQVKYTGTVKIRCICTVHRMNMDGHGVFGHPVMRRDYADEKPVMKPDWQPGYNYGIDYHYKNKADLMGEIRRRGFYPSVHGGGTTRTKAGLYGDEEYKEMYTPSPKEDLFDTDKYDHVELPLPKNLLED